MVHMAGHWLSTIATLKRLGFQNLRGHRSLVRDARKLQLLEDFDLRLAGPPAGTAKLALPVAVFESMALSPIMATCPNLSEVVAAIKIWRGTSADDYSSMHVGAHYLTGSERVSAYKRAPEILGRAGCLVRQLMKNSTMAASPLFATGVPTPQLRISPQTLKVRAESSGWRYYPTDCAMWGYPME
ncbi:Group ii intron reverse transcriptase maturase [Caligus rogercresseyi]|uniref:Group ii intron reverse transcriptase maturase n=1 Tax=Caligus rogercresseyi TaxID=217165 RepID=A0A7T8GTK1_CALRO|nr:Group ii intron reverse transcriptase maturase [Caligus rogercresseyi]